MLLYLTHVAQAQVSYGTCYSLTHSTAYPLESDSVPDVAALQYALDQDLSQIKHNFDTIRTFYSSFHGVPVVPSAAAVGLKVFLGIYVTDEAWYNNQVDDAVQGVAQHPETVQAILVGNENIQLQGEGPGPYTPSRIVELMEEIRQRTSTPVPIGTVQRITEWLEGSDEMDALAEASDIIGLLFLHVRSTQ